MEQRPLIIILADISGYTRFMLESRQAALHGQTVINGLIEALLREVDIPLTLQEIEGDAVFLYAAHPGSDTEWRSIVAEVSRKFSAFFTTFIRESGAMQELTPCECAVCRNAEYLGLKIVVHVGEAVFHQLAGRPQISGPDVILAHRLLKNSVASNEYLLLTEAAWAAMGAFLSGDFVRHREAYEGFGTLDLRVQDLSDRFLAARDRVYRLDAGGMREAVSDYTANMRRLTVQSATQAAAPGVAAHVALRDRLLNLFEAYVLFPFWGVFLRRALPGELAARGRRRTREVTPPGGAHR